METKLTLKMKKSIIDRAKKYAHNRETSLSKLVEKYLETITSPAGQKEDISPLVRSISGVIRLPEDFDHKEIYRNALKDKYL
jgi:hypothetical protein